MARSRIQLLSVALAAGVSLSALAITHIAAQEGLSLRDASVREVVAAVIRHGGSVFDGITSDGVTIEAGLTTASIGPLGTARDAEAPALIPARIDPSDLSASDDAGPGPAVPEIFSPDAFAPPTRFIEQQGRRQSPETPLLRSVIDLYRRGEIGAADLSASAVQDPAMKAVLEWTAIRLQPQAVGFKRIVAFMLANPDWPGQKSLRKRAEEALVSERRDGKTVLAFFADAKPETTLGKFAYAKALVADNRREEAASLVREFWRTDDFNAEIESKVLESFADVLKASDHRSRVERALFKQDYGDAQRNAGRLGEDYGKLVKARIAVERNASNAGALLDGVAKELKSDPSYLFGRAQWLRRQDKVVEAAKLIAGMTRDPAILANPQEWWTERRVLTRKLLDIGEQRLAYEVARDYPQGDSAVMIEAEFHAGWIALRFLSNPDAAKAHFAAAASVASTPISIARAAYWQGRAAEAAKEDAQPFFAKAAEQPTTYYGQLARVRLGLTDLPVRRASLEAAPPFERLRAAKAIRLLAETEARDLLFPLYKEMAQSLTSETDLDALAAFAASQDDARALLTVGKTAVQRGFPLDNHAFPLIGVPVFELRQQGAIERPLVYAIARQESAFDPKAVSTAGAKGLMQLMPATAKATAMRAGVGWDPDRLTDAAYNARLGATHLGDLVDDWKGSYILTIASYNAGPGNVRKWIDAYGDPRSPGIDPVDWVERIPFYETRNYVQRVLENLQVYRSRLGERATLLIDADLKRGARQ
jgi:soluble lytic murein transglycosylase